MLSLENTMRECMKMSNSEGHQILEDKVEVRVQYYHITP